VNLTRQFSFDDDNGESDHTAQLSCSSPLPPRLVCMLSAITTSGAKATSTPTSRTSALSHVIDYEVGNEGHAELVFG
jgi:hypothetical protein